MNADSLGQEIEITQKDMIVSSTDKTGKIIYANDIFCDVAGYTREEVIGQPHNMIRHPDMPKVVFKLLWDRVLNGEIIYAFVKNRARNGDFYWVKAYVKPIVKDGEVIKITSYRKPLNAFAKKIITKLYAQLVEYEKTHSVDESMQFLLNYLKERDLNYDQFIDRLSLEKNIENVAIRNLDFNAQKNLHIVYKEFINSCIQSKDFDALESMNDEIHTFDTWCEEVKNEPFISDAAWKSMKDSQERFHTVLETYIHKAKNDEPLGNTSESLSKLDVDIDNMFNQLSLIRDNY